MLRYPTTAELAYGSRRRGCFEDPDDVKHPTAGLDCPEITPVEYEEGDGQHNPLAMKNPSQLVRVEIY